MFNWRLYSRYLRKLWRSCSLRGQWLQNSFLLLPLRTRQPLSHPVYQSNTQRIFLHWLLTLSLHYFFCHYCWWLSWIGRKQYDYQLVIDSAVYRNERYLLMTFGSSYSLIGLPVSHDISIRWTTMSGYLRMGEVKWV